MSLSQLPRFGREVKDEARRVTWPSFKDTRTMSLMVFILVSLVALFLVLIDVLIGFSLSSILGIKF